MELGRKYLANKEFIKNIRHNGHNYILRSVFDTNNSKYNFDNTIAKYKEKENKWDFDKSIKQKVLSNDLLDLYNTGLFENKKYPKK